MSSIVADPSLMDKFVLKLVFPGSSKGSSELRRIRLNRVQDADCKLSFDILGKLAISCALQDDDDNEAVDNFVLTMSYIDEENDVIQLTSSEELEDAVSQFLEQGYVKIYTDVNRKGLRTRNTPDHGADSNSLINEHQESSDQYQGTTAADSLNRPPSSGNIKMARLSIAGVGNPSSEEGGSLPQRIEKPSLADCITHLQGITQSLEVGIPLEISVGDADSHAESSILCNSIQDLESTPPSNNNASETSGDLQPLPFIHFRHICDHCRASPIVGKRFRSKHQSNFDLCEKCMLQSKFDSSHFQEAESPVDRKYQVTMRDRDLAANDEAPTLPVPVEENGPNESEKESEAAGPPFIHGRHRCNGCTVTPIVGTRYHATNWEDFDLCEKCWTNYEGSDVQFEIVQLERDEGWQDRWRRRLSMNKYSDITPDLLLSSSNIQQLLA